jgi:hypothetical protein
MEIIAAIWLFALSEEMKINRQEINHLSDEIIVLQAAHSSLTARHIIDHDTHHAKIDKNIEAIKNIEQKLNSLSN